VIILNWSPGESAKIVANFEAALWHEVGGELRSAVYNFLKITFPINTCIHVTGKGKISKPGTLTNPIKQALLKWPGACKHKSHPIGDTKFRLQPDFEIPLQSRVNVAVESQFALRESVFFDILKHAELQRRGASHVLVELVPSDALSVDLPGSANLSWLREMLQTIVWPYLVTNTVKIIVVPINLVKDVCG
jgi:hypothetical protein